MTCVSIKPPISTRVTDPVTGLFITEALHPFEVFQNAGFEVDLVSETGTYQPDWLSQQKDWLSDAERAIYEDHSSEFRSKLDKLLKPSDIDPAKVSCSFCPPLTIEYLGANERIIFSMGCSSLLLVMLL